MTPESVVSPPTTNRMVVVVGAINVDLVVAADHLPRPGETVVGPRLERHGGGKGANAAVAACPRRRRSASHRSGGRTTTLAASAVEELRAARDRCKWHCRLAR